MNAKRTIEEYDRVVRQRENGLALDVPVGRGGLPPASLVEGDGPFYAMEVQPSYVSSRCLVSMDTDMADRITFTYGGINIDKQGHALTADKTILPGLLVAGVDAGGFSNFGICWRSCTRFRHWYLGSERGGARTGTPATASSSARYKRF